VARHHDRQAVLAIRAPDGAHCLRLADAARELGIRARLADGIASSAFQTRDWNGDPVNATGVSNARRASCEVLAELAVDLLEIRMAAGQRTRAQPLLKRGERTLEPAPVDEVEEMQAAIVGECQHRAERRLDPLRVQHAHVACPRRRGAYELRERLAKAACGFESLVEL
jgi:hypothetical protein